MSLHFTTGFLIFSTAISFLGLITNGLSLYHVLKSFDFRKSVYFLMLMDSLVSFMSSFGQTFIFIKAAAFEVERPLLYCLLFQALPYTAMFFGFAFSALIAAIRFTTLSRGLPSESMVFITIGIVAFIHVAFETSYFISVYLSGVAYGASPEFCAMGPNPRPLHVSGLLPLATLVFYVALSLSFDFAIMYAIRRRVGANELIRTHQGDYLKIPVRATTFSALCFAPLALFGLAQKLHETEASIEVGAYLAQTTALVATTFRAPLTLMLTFNSMRSVVAKERRLALREKRLRKELKYAFKAKRQSNQSIYTIC